MFHGCHAVTFPMIDNYEGITKSLRETRVTLTIVDAIDDRVKFIDNPLSTTLDALCLIKNNYFGQYLPAHKCQN